MPSSPNSFSALSAGQQLRLVLSQGTYLTWRRGPAGNLHLYHLAEGAKGLYVELFYDAALNLIRIARSFTDTAPLGEYLAALRLPG